MAKDKERTLNPAAAHLKSQKKSAVKKGKAQLAQQRTEKLSRRNPERLQRQIDDLKATEAAQSGNLRPRDKQLLQQLERDVGAIRKAREANPQERGAPGARGRDGGHDHQHQGEARGRGGGALGKRRRTDDLDAEQSDETEEEAWEIPMPRDTPPPIPARPRKQRRSDGDDPNALPLGERAPPKPAAAQTTYTSAPQIRNLQKEATARFVPAAVAARLKQRAAFSGSAEGRGEEQRLLEPEQVDALERDGYLAARGAADEAAKEEAFMHMADPGAGDAADAGGGTMEEEEAAFERELREAERELQGDVGPQGQDYVDRRGLEAEADANVEEDAKGPERDHARYQMVEDVEDDDW